MFQYDEWYNVLGVHVSAVNMDKALRFIAENLEELKGKYICVSNVHTTVMSYEDADYCSIQNNAAMVLPDGGPLSRVGRKMGIDSIGRVTGPDLMKELFIISNTAGYRHYFYGSTEDTLACLQRRLKETYPNIDIVGSASPPFRALTPEEDEDIIKEINQSHPDFVWVGLGAPKQERWMAEHQEHIHGLMIGVGAGFDYHAGKIKRAPVWMQNHNLEWLYRLCQEPGRLMGRYVRTNIKFLYLIHKKCGKIDG